MIPESQYFDTFVAMSQVQRKFVYKLIVFSFVLLGVSALLFLAVVPSWYTPMFPIQFFLISLVTFFSYSRLLKACDVNPLRFSTVYIGTTTMKLFIYLSFLVGCLLLVKTDVLKFLMTFFALYVCFTVFEIIQVLSFCKVKKS